MIWLKNCTSTKAIPTGKTPYRMVTGKKVNLSELPKWGSLVWVHNNSGVKLDGCAKEGHWVVFDEQSKGSRVYWPEKHTVTVEHSVTFTGPIVIDGLEGEELTEPEHLVKLPSLTPIFKTLTDSDELTPTSVNNLTTEPVVESRPESRPQCVCKLTICLDVLQGQDTATGLAVHPVMPPSLQDVDLSLNVDMEQEVEGEDHEEDAAEVIMVVDVMNAEASEPKSLAKAKCHPDWVE